MTIYDSSVPVVIEVAQSGATYTLQLVSSATGSATLGPTDAARATTTSAFISAQIGPGTTDVTITSVTATSYRDAPERIPWVADLGVFTGIFPAPEQVGEFMWDLVVSFTTPDRSVHSLDPRMIVRKTNP